MCAAEQRWKRSPTEEEIAAELGVGIEEYRDWLVESRGLDIGSLEFSNSDQQPQDLLKFIADTEESTPARLLERAELERLLARGIERMPAVEKTVLSLYFIEELTLREIAEVVKLHESRISQLKSQAILRLRGYMVQHWPATGGFLRA
jgi:RNA polymerase sigma factor for flagellar operon FliA